MTGQDRKRSITGKDKIRHERIEIPLP